MPVPDYGVWKGLPVHYEYENRYEDSHSPHLSLYYHDKEGTVPHFDPDYRLKHKGKARNKNRPKEIPGLFRAAINIKSTDQDSRLAYWVNQNIIEHPIARKLANLEFGFHSLQDSDGEGLDFIRSDLFDTRSGRVLPHDIDGPDNDIIDVLVPQVEHAINENADIYLFGSRFNTKNGIHDVHMNQGNIEKFADDDGVSQDGGLLIHYKDAQNDQNDQWTGIFLAFASQSIHTDDQQGHAIPDASGRLVTWGDFITPERVESSVAIKEAYVNPPGPDDRSIRRRKSITLENLTHHKVSLSSWKLKNSAGQVQELPHNAALKSMATGMFEVPNWSLLNEGDTITLLNEQGLKVDGVSYGARQGRMEGQPIVFAH
ncbi:uncharacterized protein ACLA_043840 [Aspergillus clavatus NRRL 1]|uniref:LTD domain-containing protein n=1 Tax=Aspergillus clavatus (strain ATCC 1007 / CBS 513.65 / DSM 816 / NCTC 3887 / NRRL 1 / QM 1276 / 107) TaxID=344612 RepID=A1C8M7_ASPCL|nr:uncharacterized protein ACLA_043840 [Aspergillus clavatus NRRL 1]EAW13664.1 conserved hypothetical protein [Aspergillus clavatus NRRL 1]